MTGRFWGEGRQKTSIHGFIKSSMYYPVLIILIPASFHCIIASIETGKLDLSKKAHNEARKH